MVQNETIKDRRQPDIDVGKEIILLIYDDNVSHSSWFTPTNAVSPTMGAEMKLKNVLKTNFPKNIWRKKC